MTEKSLRPSFPAAGGWARKTFSCVFFFPTLPIEQHSNSSLPNQAIFCVLTPLIPRYRIRLAKYPVIPNLLMTSFNIFQLSDIKGKERQSIGRLQRSMRVEHNPSRNSCGHFATPPPTPPVLLHSGYAEPQERGCCRGMPNET